MVQQWQGLADEEVAQAQKLLRILALALIVGGGCLASVATFLALGGSGSILETAGGVVAAAVGLVVYAFNRRGWIRPAGLLVAGISIAIPAYYLVVEGPRTTGLLLFPLGAVFADYLLGGRSGLVVTTINVLLYLGIGLAHEFGWVKVAYVTDLVSDVLSVIIIGYGLDLATRFFTREWRKALLQSGARERALRSADEEKDRLLADLQARDEVQQQLLETVYELGSPIIPLAPGVVALPLIGALDGQRAQQVTAALLRGVVEHRATVAIVDITGVPVVDSAVAEALLQAARGVWLLGAEPVLTGIQVETAQTLVGLGVDLSRVNTLATLQEGLEYALARRGATR